MKVIGRVESLWRYPVKSTRGMITLDPDTSEANPEVMRLVAGSHDGTAGIYGAVLVEGVIRQGDEITLAELSVEDLG